MQHGRSFFIATTLTTLTFALVQCSSGRPSAPPPPPTITFFKPAAGSQLHGSVSIEVHAQGATKIASFSFLQPSQLAGVAATFDPATRTAVLAADLDLTSFPDGDLTIQVSATDDLDHSSTQGLAVKVAQAVPQITVSSPSDGSTVKGSAVAIAASAAAQNGASITKLEIVNPPAGIAPNTSPAANLLTSTWDTTQALEGPASLHFRATDSSGLVADKTLSVTVDNVPFGTFDVRVSAGNPIAGATVTIYAIEDATGNVATGVGQGGVLGTSGPTDPSGRILVTLTAENYTGPVQIVASGTSLQYVDPAIAAPLTNIAIPSTFVLSSLLPSYATGSGVTTPLTLWTTLADHEALSVARGKHPNYPGTHAVSWALAQRDQLFVDHVVKNASAWAPTALRTTVPAMLSQGPQTLVDVAYAELFDLALDKLGHDTAVRAGYSASSTTINAITLAQLLEQDVDADGMFDGKGDGGAVLATTGAVPVTLDAQFLRVPLATALDEWIFDTTLNKSGITRTDLTNAGVYGYISTDASDLFGAPPSGSFDDTPPTVTYAFSYSIAGGPQNATPVGAQAFAGGTVRIVVDAADPSGVQSVAVKAGATALVPQPGSTTSHFIGVVDSTLFPDGPLPFTITALDIHNNSGNTLTSVTVDNTPPGIAVAAPSNATYYSASIPFNATAGDAGSGVATIATSGFSGLTNTSLAIGQFIGTWAIPTSQPDGLVTGGYVSCDNVGNCTQPSTGTVNLHLDRTAPAVVLNPLPSPIQCVAGSCYTSVGSFVLSGTVSDGGGAGVHDVYVQVGASLISVTVSGNTWTAKVPLSLGNNVITAWADDLAVPPNSGSGSPISVQVAYVTSGPTPAIASTPSYFDESGLTVAADGSGFAIVPASYQFATGSTKVAVGTGSTVNKVATRLGWATQPTAAQLEADNGSQLNIPFVQFSASTSAPVVTATWTLAFTAGATTYSHTGDLAPWQSSASGNTAVYDLPLASNLIPELLDTPAGVPGTVTFSITLTDAAGNIGTSPTGSITFHVLGPPVAWVEDASYATANDPRSTYYYKTTNGTYMGMFAASPVFGPEGAVRLVRYILTNPASVPVAVSLPVTQRVDSSTPPESTWADLESYGDQDRAFTGNITDDGYTFAASYNWSSNNGGGTCPPVSPCGLVGQYCGHTTGSSTQWIREAVPTLASVTNGRDAHGAVTALAYQNGAAGYDTTLLPGTGGYYTVPAASAASPGTIVVYLTRQAAPPSGKGISWPWISAIPGDPLGYEFPVQDWYIQRAGFTACKTAAGTNANYEAFDGHRQVRYLSGPLDDLSGSVTIATSGLNSGMTVAGETRSLTTTTFTRRIGH